MLARAYVLLAAAVVSGAATVTNANTRLWQPQQYVRKVIENSPEVQQALERQTAARANERSFYARSFFPTLGFSATLNPAEIGPGSRFTAGSWRPSANDISLSPSVSWNIFNHFQDKLNLRANTISSDVSAQALEISRQAEALEALRNYYGLLLSNKFEEVARQNLAVQKENYELTQTRYKFGMKSLSDLLKTETDFRTSELNVETRAAQRLLAIFNFNVEIGRDEDAGVEFPKLELGDTAIPKLSEGLVEAMKNRPEMIQNRLELENADITLRLAKIQAGPTFSFDFSYSDSVDAQFRQRATSFGLNDATYGVSLTLSLPSSFNVYSQLKNIESADADWRRSRQTAEALRRRIRREVYEAHIDLVRAYRSYEISLRREDIARQNLDIVKEQYSQGSADVIRLSEAQADHLNAQENLIRAFRDAKINQARYRRAIGESIWR